MDNILDQGFYSRHVSSDRSRGGAFELLCSTLVEIAHKKYEKSEDSSSTDDGIEFFDLSEVTEDEQRGTG